MTIPFLSVKPRSIKLKVSPRFPAQLIGRAGIDVTKSSGNYYLDLDYTDFPVIGAAPVSATYALIFDPATGQYKQLPISLLGGGGGLADAPNDGFAYVRQSAVWAKAQPYSVKDFGAKGDGATDDTAAINNAIAAARAASRTLIIPDGIYSHSGTLNWAWNNFKVMAPGDNAVFLHSGTGIAHNFSGMLNYPGQQGCAGGVFGGPGRIMIKGNPAGGTTRGINIDNWHFGYMKVAIRDAAICLYGNDTGVVGSSAVETTFDVRVSNNTDGAFAVIPNSGVDFTKPVASIFEKLIVEGCGAGGNRAVYFRGAVGNLINAGTCESSFAGGVLLDSACSRNIFNAWHCEVNGSATDWTIAGSHNTFINCAGAGTTAGQSITGNRNMFFGGNWQSVVIAASAISTFFLNPQLATAFTDNGQQTTVLNPDGIFAAQDYAPAVLGNKTINTDNSINLLVASVNIATAWAAYTPTVTATSGTPTATAAGGRYKKIGKMVCVQIGVAITTVGSATGQVRATLPPGLPNVAANFCGSAIDTVSGIIGVSLIPSTVPGYIAAIPAASGNFWVNGDTVIMNCTYETP